MPKNRDSRTCNTVDFPHVQAAEAYVAGVLSGKIIACKQVRQACERHRRDIAAARTRKFPYKFDRAKANRICKFMELLPHTKGKWARKDPHTGDPQTIRLEGWQKFILCSIFGWVKKSTGKRRFQKGRIYVPRKNGKSIFGAGIGLYMLGLDGEPGAEIYSGATSEKQAWEVFGPAKQMCKIDPELAEALGVLVNAESLIREDDGGKFIPVIGKPGDGSSPHCALIDEYHEHKTSELIDTMETGMGAREQPLSLVISTAGADLAGPCREDWKTCEALLENAGGFEDETLWCIIYTIDADVPWDSPEAMQMANPNLGVSIDREWMDARLNTARQKPNEQTRYRTKHLNQWVSAKNAYFNLAAWNSLAQPNITREDFKHCPSYLAGDLASKHDLVALMQLFCLPDGKFAIFGHYFLPEATVELPENQHYRNWHLRGNLEIAGVDVTDLDYFKEAALEYCAAYDVLEMPSDPNRAWGVYPALEREGVPIVEYRNTVLTMSEPMKQLDALIRAGKIIHNGDPILAWAIANTTGKHDAKDNVYPNRESPANKIDPVVATLMALGRAMTRAPEEEGSALIYF